MFQIPIWVMYAVFCIEFLIAFFFLSVFIKVKLMKKEDLGKVDYNVTFVLPAYNHSALLENSIKSIKSLDYQQEKIKIIIVDDGSTDDTVTVMKKLAKKYEGISFFTKKHGGKSAAVNYGLERANTELIVVLDADTVLEKDILTKALPMFNNPSIAAVTSKMRPLFMNKFIERMQYVEYTFTGFYRMLMGKIGSLPLTPAFSIFRKEFFEKHGYFDVDSMTEDFEMGLRIQSKHHDIGFVHDSCAITEVPNTLRKFIRQRLRWGYGTLSSYKKYKWMIFNKNYGDLGMFILPIWFIGMLIASAIFLLGIYSIIENSIDYIARLLVGWRPSFYFSIDNFMISLLNLKVMLFGISIILGLMLFFLIRSQLNERIKLKDYILFVIIYLWILSFTSILSLAYFLIGKKPKW